MASMRGFGAVSDHRLRSEFSNHSGGAAGGGHPPKVNN
jgi:hypothetical protein